VHRLFTITLQSYSVVKANNKSRNDTYKVFSHLWSRWLDCSLHWFGSSC